jgi:hypothetical protein
VRGVAFALATGSWLVVVGLVATLLAALWPRVQPRFGQKLSRWGPWFLQGLSTREAIVAFAALAFVVALAALPGWRRYGPVGGDEPKYLRIAWSLHRDLDADVAADQEAPLTASQLVRNARRLASATVAAAGALLRGERPPDDHEWARGNWTVAGWHGGLYHVQGPGLPGLLAPGLGFASPDVPLMPPPAFVLLAALFALALTQTALLAAEVSGSRGAGFLAAALVATSPAVFVVSYHLYPEVAAAAALPWLARFARPNGPEPGPFRAATIGLVAGGLVWLHVKLLLVAVVSAGLVGVRLRRRFAPLAALAGGLAVPTLAFLLFQYRLTGLFRPDGLYLRYASDVWSGVQGFVSWRFLGGLANALVGGRDGLLVMAPPVVAGLLAAPRLAARDRGGAVVLLLLVSALCIAAAVHGGGAPGPPGRLMSPAAGLVAAALAVGLVELRRPLAFRWATATLVLVALAVTLTMGRDARRTVKPFRGLPAEADLSRDLPAGSPAAADAAVDMARAAVLLGAVGFWARRLARSRPDASTDAPATWRSAVAFQAGAWLSVVVVAGILDLLTRLHGP